MKSQRFAARKDKNQNQFEAFLNLAGYTWISTHRAGFGFPDIAVKTKSNLIVLYEIKLPGKDLTKNEKRFFVEWDGCPVERVESIDEMQRSLEYWDDCVIEQGGL